MTDSSIVPASLDRNLSEYACVADTSPLGLSHIICQKLVPRSDGKGRVVAMEVLNNVYGMGNLIRLGKVEQIYSLLQSRTRDVPEERMVTFERSLATLVKAGLVTPLEAEKWANQPTAFADEMQHVQESRPGP